MAEEFKLSGVAREGVGDDTVKGAMETCLVVLCMDHGASSNSIADLGTSPKIDEHSMATLSLFPRAKLWVMESLTPVATEDLSIQQDNPLGLMVLY